MESEGLAPLWVTVTEHCPKLTASISFHIKLHVPAATFAGLAANVLCAALWEITFVIVVEPTKSPSATDSCNASGVRDTLDGKPARFTTPGCKVVKEELTDSLRITNVSLQPGSTGANVRDAAAGGTLRELV